VLHACAAKFGRGSEQLFTRRRGYDLADLAIGGSLISTETIRQTKSQNRDVRQVFSSRAKRRFAQNVSSVRRLLPAYRAAT
jgi:hypothetical protein